MSFPSFPPIKRADSPINGNGFNPRNDKEIPFTPFQGEVKKDKDDEDSTLNKSRSFSDFSTFERELRTEEKKCVKSLKTYMNSLKIGSNKDDDSLDNLLLFNNLNTNTKLFNNSIDLPSFSDLSSFNMDNSNVFPNVDFSDSSSSTSLEVLERQPGEIFLNEENPQALLLQFDAAIEMQQDKLDALSPKKTWTTVALVIAGVAAIAFAALAVIFTPYFAIGFVAGFAALAVLAHYNSSFSEEEKKIIELKDRLEEIRALFNSIKEEDVKKAAEFRELMNDESEDFFYTPELLVEGWNTYQSLAPLQKKIFDYQKERPQPLDEISPNFLGDNDNIGDPV